MTLLEKQIIGKMHLFGEGFPPKDSPMTGILRNTS